MSLIAALPLRRCLRLFALLLPLLAATSPALTADEDFLPVRSAYKVALSAAPDELVVRFDIADGYYLYRDRLGFESATPGVTLGKASLPVGLDHEDEFFGRQVIYRNTANVGVPITFSGTPRDFEVKVKLQGCADAGLCYPPQTWTLPVTWPQGIAGSTRGTGSAAKSGGFSLRSLLGSGAKSDADFLLADQAFVFSTESSSRDRVRLRWDIADDYYLYRDKVTVKTTATNVQLGSVSIPGGEKKHDEYFGEQVVFHDQMLADVPVVAADGVTEVPLEVTYQGCADAGLCYPPIKKTVVVKLAATTTPASLPVAGPVGGPSPCARSRTCSRTRSATVTCWPCWRPSSASACCSRSRPACCRWCRSSPASSWAQATANRCRAAAPSHCRSPTCLAWRSRTRSRAPRSRPLASRRRRSSRSRG